MVRESLRIRQDLHASDNFLYNQSRNEQELINFIESIMESDNIPGLSVAVVKGEYIVWNKSFGMANIIQNIPVSDTTMFMLASVSKTVTATALMQLWEDDLINLDEDINSYLPFNVVHPDYPNIPITPKMLLTHTSGIKDNWNVMDYYDGDSELALGYYLEQYLTPNGDFYNPNANFTNQTPGTNYRYSNIGAAVIGFLVEVISNQPFNEYCNENIFTPLDMQSRWFLSELNIDEIAIPYELGGDVDFIPIQHYGYADYPSGQLRSSATDLAKFLVIYNNGGVYQNTRILDEETIEFIKTILYPNIDHQQAVIWYYKNQDNRILFGHNGGDLGVSTEMFISLLDEIGVIVLTNCSNYSSIIEIEEAIFDFTDEYDFALLGDINFDTEINVLDVILILNMILDDTYSDIADINFDGLINIQDIIILINLVLSD